MSISIEPAIYNPRVVTLPSGRTVLSEFEYLIDWENFEDEKNEKIPFVSLSNDNAANLFSALGLPKPEEGSYFKALEMKSAIAKLIERGSAYAAEFSCSSQSTNIAQSLGAKVIDCSNYSGDGVIERANRLLNLIDWAIATYGEDAILAVS